MIYLDKLANFLSNFPESSEAQNIMNTLYQIDPKFQVANITMQDLFSDAAGLWSSFGQWYTQIFGEGGILNAELLQVQDGQTTLDEVHITIKGAPDDYIATDLFRDIPD